MNENETPASKNDEAPKKSSRTMILIVVGVALGLVLLVALNMK